MESGQKTLYRENTLVGLRKGAFSVWARRCSDGDSHGRLISGAKPDRDNTNRRR